MVQGDGRPPEVDVDEWFDAEHPRMVGLARRVIDPDDSTPASLEAARAASIRAFVRLHHRPPKDRDDRIVATVRTVLDECLPLLMGNPAVVQLRPDALGDDLVFDGTLGLAELHDALQAMGRRARHSGLLSMAAGLSAVEVAALLDEPLDATLEHLGHVSTRLADRRRLGMDHLVGPT
ncbi:MAG: hypothetical protein ACK4V6_10210 [Microthrixaceae bacterium]